jgi:hypothetical protein
VQARESRPDLDFGRLRCEAEAFPGPADFPEALRQIGYREHARSRVAPPTPEDYWLFLSKLSREGSDEDPLELIRKVLALR